MLGGASSWDATRSAGLDPARVEAIYTRFQQSLVDVMEDSARRIVAESLDHSSIDTTPEIKGGPGCQSSDGMMDDILAELGVFENRFIDDTQPGFVDRRGERALASSPVDMMTDIMREFGFPQWEEIDDTQPGFVDRRGERALASSPLDTMIDIKRQLGLPPWEEIDDSQPGFVDRRGERAMAPRKRPPDDGV